MKMKSLLSLVSLLFLGSSKANTNPNVIIFLSDDESTIKEYGGKKFHTPNLDLLKENSVVFDNARSPSGVCGPSRASILTGIETQRSTLRDNDERLQIIKKDGPTIADFLKELGYRTELYGKPSHGGIGTPTDPYALGFDLHIGSQHHKKSHTGTPKYYYIGNKRQRIPENRKVSFKKCVIEQKCKFMDEIIRDAMVKSIMEHDFSTPYMGMMSMYYPHLLKLSDKLNSKHMTYLVPASGFHNEYPLAIRRYADNIYQIDVSVGAILGAIAARNQTENTIVIYGSDNGGPDYWIKPGGKYRLRDSHPLDRNKRGEKRTVFEKGIDVPFSISWQGVFTPRRIETNVNLYDIFITLRHLFNKDGLPDRYFTETYSGPVSLLPILQGESPSSIKRKNMFMELCPRNMESAKKPCTWAGIRTEGVYENIKIVFGPPRDYIKQPYNSKRFQLFLFNLTEDPFEKVNLKSKYPELVDEFVADREENRIKLIA